MTTGQWRFRKILTSCMRIFLLIKTSSLSIDYLPIALDRLVLDV